MLCSFAPRQHQRLRCATQRARFVMLYLVRVWAYNLVTRDCKYRSWTHLLPPLFGPIVRDSRAFAYQWERIRGRYSAQGLQLLVRSTGTRPTDLLHEQENWDDGVLRLNIAGRFACDTRYSRSHPLVDLANNCIPERCTSLLSGVLQLARVPDRRCSFVRRKLAEPKGTEMLLVSCLFCVSPSIACSRCSS